MAETALKQPHAALGERAATQHVLISDRVAPECLAVFEGERARGAVPIAVDYRPGLTRAALCEAIAQADALIVRSATQVDAELLAAAPRLRAIVRAGVGVDNIALDVATQRGIVVMNCPTGNTVAAAEHTIAMMCALMRNIAPAHAALTAGRWEPSKFTGVEITGKVIGIVGLGKVGREVAKRARGLGMTPVGYDPFVSPELADALEVEVAPLDEVIRRADVLSVHVPLTEQTRGLIGAEAFRAMKPGARIVNVARGGVVDEAALAEAIKSGKVAGAAIDVFAEEPVAKDHPLLKLPQVLVTPHLGASTHEAQQAVGTQSAEQIIDFLRDGMITNAVNTVSVAPALLKKVGPWRELATKLGSLQGQLRSGTVRRVTVRYAGELFGADERRLLQIAFLQGFLRDYLDTPVNAVNATLFAKDHGVQVGEERTLQAEGYVNLLTTEVETRTESHQISVRRVAGTVFGESHLRIVQMDGYTTDAYPRGDMLLVTNDDTPGIIGRIGTVLGEAKINIATMAVGRDVTGGTAVAILNIDSPVPEDVQRRLTAHPGIVWVKAVSL